MDQLTKSSSGLLYEEKFSENLSLIWDFVPNNLNRVSLKPSSIEILPGDERIEMLMPCPTGSAWACQTHISYAGRTSTESAGFILKSITDNVAECELKGDTSEMFDYLKMELDSESTFSLKASKDGLYWKDFGNSKMLDANKFGFYMNELTQHDPLILKSIVVCKNNFITVHDVPTDATVVVYDINDANITHRFIISKKNNKLVIDGSNMIFPIPYLKIKFLDKEFNELRVAELKDIYGGDTFDFSYDITFTIEGEELTNEDYSLDTVAGPFKLYAVQIMNNEDYDLADRTLKIEASSVFNPGDVPVTIAETTTLDNVTNLDFKKELVITLKAHENKNFYMKIEKTNNIPVLDSEYRFKISLV